MNSDAFGVSETDSMQIENVSLFFTSHRNVDERVVVRAPPAGLVVQIESGHRHLVALAAFPFVSDVPKRGVPHDVPTVHEGCKQPAAASLRVWKGRGRSRLVSLPLACCPHVYIAPVSADSKAHCSSVLYSNTCSRLASDEAW